MNNKSRAFILTEILTGMMLQAGFIIVLCGAFYMTINFYTRTTKILAAREKGQRVISFLDEKVRHAGLGLWRCSSSSNIKKLMSQVKELQKLENLPVSINKYNNITKDNWLSTFGDGAKGVKYGDIIHGNILTLLYAEKMHNIFLAIDTKKRIPAALTSDDRDNDVSLIVKKDNDITNVFNNNLTPSFLNSWSVLPTSGVPLLLKKSPTKQFIISADISTQSIDIASGAELLKLKCERFFVENDNSERATGRNFAYFEFENSWDRNTSNKKNNYEPGILETYYELDTGNNILNFYVLASGGYDSSINHEKPDSWPNSANWEDDYRHHYIYVSRKSWKLNNITWASTGWN